MQSCQDVSTANTTINRAQPLAARHTEDRVERRRVLRLVRQKRIDCFSPRMYTYPRKLNRLDYATTSYETDSVFSQASKMTVKPIV